MTCNRCDEPEEVEITTDCGSVCLCRFCGNAWWAMHLDRDELSEALNENPTESCMADYRSDRSQGKYTVAFTVMTTCRIINRFRSRLPTVEELVSEYGMSRATAYRWRAALYEARRAENNT